MSYGTIFSLLLLAEPKTFPTSVGMLYPVFTSDKIGMSYGTIFSLLLLAEPKTFPTKVGMLYPVFTSDKIGMSYGTILRLQRKANLCFFSVPTAIFSKRIFSLICLKQVLYLCRYEKA
jgi:hypothetical protein